MFQYPDEGEGQRQGFLAGLREDEVATVLRYAQSRRYGTGDRAVTAGDTDRSLFIIVAGSFDVVAPGAARARALLRAGNIFGELAFFDGLPRSADVVAVEPSEALVMTTAGFERLRLNEPRLAILFVIDLGRLLSVRLRELRRRGEGGRPR